MEIFCKFCKGKMKGNKKKRRIEVERQNIDGNRKMQEVKKEWIEKEQKGDDKTCSK